MSLTTAITRLYGNVANEITRREDVGFRALVGGQVPSYAKDHVVDLSVIPDTIAGDEAVITEGKLAAIAEESAYLTKQFLRHRKRRIAAGTETYQATADFVIDLMKQAETLGQIDTRFSRSMLRHGLRMDTLQNEVEGYVQAHNSFMTMIGSV